MAHTKGPWVNHNGIIRDATPEGWLVATCRFNPKDEDNARLIAAAPELLTSVDDLLTWVEALAIAGSATPDAWKQLDKVRSKAEAAIAKAKGQ